MTLYEIDSKILACVDAETGEILDEEALAALEIARQEKLENAALWIKNLTAEENAIRQEAATLLVRARAKATTIEGLKKYLLDALNGGTLETSRVKVSCRTSTAVEVTDEDAIKENFPELFRVAYILDKKELRERLKTVEVEGAYMASRPYIVIK